MIKAVHCVCIVYRAKGMERKGREGEEKRRRSSIWIQVFERKGEGGNFTQYGDEVFGSESAWEWELSHVKVYENDFTCLIILSSQLLILFTLSKLSCLLVILAYIIDSFVKRLPLQISQLTKIILPWRLKKSFHFLFAYFSTWRVLYPSISMAYSVRYTQT